MWLMYFCFSYYPQFLSIYILAIINNSFFWYCHFAKHKLYAVTSNIPQTQTIIGKTNINVNHSSAFVAAVEIIIIIIIEI